MVTSLRFERDAPGTGSTGPAAAARPASQVAIAF